MYATVRGDIEATFSRRQQVSCRNQVSTTSLSRITYYSVLQINLLAKGGCPSLAFLKAPSCTQSASNFYPSSARPTCTCCRCAVFVRPQNARAVAQRYSDILEKQRTHAEKAERERLRVQAETTRLLEKADGLERRAEEEATQVIITDKSEDKLRGGTWCLSHAWTALQPSVSAVFCAYGEHMIFYPSLSHSTSAGCPSSVRNGERARGIVTRGLYGRSKGEGAHGHCG